MNFLLDLVPAFTVWREILFAKQTDRDGFEGWIGWREGDALVAGYFEHIRTWDAPITSPHFRWREQYDKGSQYRAAIRAVFPFQGRREGWLAVTPSLAGIRFWKTPRHSGGFKLGPGGFRGWDNAAFSIRAFQDPRARAKEMIANARVTLDRLHADGGVPLPLEVGYTELSQADGNVMPFSRRVHFLNCTSFYKTQHWPP